jgi:hypothetical protein
MKRIVQIFDAQHFTPEALDFSASIVRHSGSTLTGLFIQDTSFINDPGMNIIAGQFYVEEIVLTAEEKQKIQDATDASVAAFTKACAQHNITGNAIVKQGIPAEILKTESRYCDMMIVSPLLSFDGEQAVPTVFVYNLLAAAECPVLLSPERFQNIDEVIIAFDGSKSASFAIRQFAYMLPSLCTAKIVVINISEEGGKDTSIAVHHPSFTEWMDLHCPGYRQITLVGNARDVLFNYFMENDDNNKLLVAGSFGRSAVSRFFKPGTTELVLKTADVPVFIVHN